MSYYHFLCDEGHSIISSDPFYLKCDAALKEDGSPLVTKDRVPEDSLRCGAEVWMVEEEDADSPD